MSDPHGMHPQFLEGYKAGFAKGKEENHLGGAAEETKKPLHLYLTCEHPGQDIYTRACHRCGHMFSVDVTALKAKLAEVEKGQWLDHQRAEVAERKLAAAEAVGERNFNAAESAIAEANEAHKLADRLAAQLKTAQWGSCDGCSRVKDEPGYAHCIACTQVTAWNEDYSGHVPMHEPGCPIAAALAEWEAQRK